MKKINEASTLSALGLNKEDIAELHTLGIVLPHDMEYLPVTTKSQAIAYIKQKHLLVGRNAAGQAVGILHNRGYPRDYTVVINGRTKIVGSMKDALAFLPGKAEWFRSAEPVRSPRGSEYAEKENKDEEYMSNLVSRAEKIYGKKLRSEARKYAQEIRRSIGSAVTQDKRKRRYGEYGPTATESIEALKTGYDQLDEIAKSKTPFNTLEAVTRGNWSDNRHRFAGMVASEVTGDRGYGRHSSDKAGAWAQENPAAMAKIARFALSKLRGIRDGAFEKYHKQKDPLEAEPYRLRVREAYDRFGETGKVTSITKDKK